VKYHSFVKTVVTCLFQCISVCISVKPFGSVILPQMQVFCVVLPCHEASSSDCSEELRCLHLQGPGSYWVLLTVQHSVTSCTVILVTCIQKYLFSILTVIPHILAIVTEAFCSFPLSMQPNARRMSHLDHDCLFPCLL